MNNDKTELLLSLKIQTKSKTVHTVNILKGTNILKFKKKPLNFSSNNKTSLYH